MSATTAPARSTTARLLLSLLHLRRVRLLQFLPLLLVSLLPLLRSSGPTWKFTVSPIEEDFRPITRSMRIKYDVRLRDFHKGRTTR
jgi:hypothetical protein